MSVFNTSNQTRTIPRPAGGNWIWEERRDGWFLLGYRVIEGADAQTDTTGTAREVTAYSMPRDERKEATRAFKADVRRLAKMNNSAMAE